MLYSNGETINLTNNSQSTVDHSHQQTNDNGQIVWSASTKQLFLYDKNISNTPINIWSSSYNYSIIPQVSNYGIVWSGYNGHSFDIYLYDFGNRGITKVAENANTTDNHGINDYGQIVWTASGNIYHWANGATTQITNSNGNGSPRINNLGQIVFTKGYYGVHNTDICFATPQPDKFVFPVLGISQTDPYKNYNDPLQDGWAGKGVGQVSATDGHLGQDYYLKIGDCAGKPVYAIYPGEVVEVMNGSGRFGWCDDSDHGWGPVLVLKHTSGNGFKVSENAIVPLGDCGTDRNPKVIYSLYGHLSKDSIKDISVGQAFEAGDQIGTIGKYGVDQASWTTNHLHFEIKDEVGFSEGSWYSSHSGQCPGTAAQSCGAQGIGTGYSHSPGFAPHRYIPSVFIVENQGRKAQVQGALNLLMTD
jgi:murein DD-endopeptidase MepM/ murein hydrolase activator NlpD